MLPKRSKLSEIIYWAAFPIKTLCVVVLTEYEFWRAVKAHALDKPLKGAFKNQRDDL